jgi:hypothetical protein
VIAFVLVLVHFDRSGIIQAFGPYGSEQDAAAAQQSLAAMPAIQGGIWECVPTYGWKP